MEKKFIMDGRKIKRIVVIIIIVSVVAGMAGYIRYKVQEKERFATEPYFTDMKLNEREMGYLVYNFYFTCTPDFSESYDMTKYPDYGYYELSANEWTEKSVFVLNFMLFTEKSESDKEAIRYAEGLGFSLENPITVEWVEKNPRKAVALMEKLSDRGDYFLQKRKVQYIYSEWALP